MFCIMYIHNEVAIVQLYYIILYLMDEIEKKNYLNIIQNTIHQKETSHFFGVVVVAGAAGTTGLALIT
jgi:hypothetical protein